MTKLFWTVALMDGVAALVLWRVFARGPHGQFDGLLVFAYYLLLGALLLAALAVQLLPSNGWRTGVLILFLLLSAPLLFSAVTALFNRVQGERKSSGSAYFDGPALELAQAMVGKDVALVKQRIPAAGDLNLPRKGGTTLWQFGVLQADGSDDSLDVLRALLAAGADPKRDASADSLEHAMARGVPLTQFLLEAGANPNVPDHQQRPVWWRALQGGEDEDSQRILKLMLDHGADLKLRAPDGRGPVGVAIAQGYWFAACLLIERGGDWKEVNLRDGSVPESLEWEILRRQEYAMPVPELLRKTLGVMGGAPAGIPQDRARSDGDVRIPELLNLVSFEKLEPARAALERLALQPDWVRRVVAFLGEGDGFRRNQVALLLSLKPEALPGDVQERCWTVLREQIAWYDRNVANSPKDRHGWLLKETVVMASGLASVPGPVRERHRQDFVGLRDRIEACRKAMDPGVADLPDLRQSEW